MLAGIGPFADSSAVVSATTLPDIREMARLSPTEIVGVVYPTGDTAIYDVYSSAVLWEAPAGSRVEVVGLDHVLVSTGTRVDVVRWR